MMPRSRQRATDVAAVVGMALLLGAVLSSAPQGPATASAPREIDVIARRFSFEPALIEVTTGERVRLLVRSGDGTHGLRVRQLRIDTVIPRGGRVVTIDFVAPAPGRYEVLCSEECGEGHSQMKASLVVTAAPQ